MIVSKMIDWQPIEAIPADRQDGRSMLLWSDGEPAVARFRLFSGHGMWVGQDGGVMDPAYWADINPPE